MNIIIILLTTFIFTPLFPAPRNIYNSLVQSTIENKNEQEENVKTLTDLTEKKSPPSARSYYDSLVEVGKKTRKKNKLYFSKDKKNNSARNYYNSLIQKSAQEQRGRTYYNSLIDQAMEYHWIVPISIHYTWVERSFNDKSDSDTLANLIFIQPFSIEDIFLFSKLSNTNKVHIDMPVDQADLDLRFSRGTVPLTGIGSRPLGTFRDDLFTTLLAPVKVNIEAELRELVVNISSMYQFCVGQKGQGIVGATFPFKSRLHIMELRLDDGNTFADLFPMHRQAVLAQFQDEFVDLNDFFNRVVVQPKGLILESRQRRTSVGDVTLFSFVDIADYINHVDSLQLGFNFVTPSGGKRKGKKVWEVLLGNGGAFQAEFFGHVLFKSSSRVFNPTFRLVGQVSAAFTSKERVPKVKSENERGKMVQEIQELLAPISAFQGYFVEPFQELDSSVLHFADQAIQTKRKLGSRVLFGVGNYFYDIFVTGFRLGLFYHFMHKQKDSLHVKATGTFNTELLERRTNERSHTISWQLAYSFKNMVELNIGSEHVIAGTNIPRYRDVFGSLVVVF